MVKKNVADNTIYVSRGYDTDKQYGKTLHLDEMHFISGNPWEGQTEPVDIMFKNRHTPVFMKARFVPLGGREYVIESEEKVQGIAPDSLPWSTTPPATSATAAESSPDRKW